MTQASITLFAKGVFFLFSNKYILEYFRHIIWENNCFYSPVRHDHVGLPSLGEGAEVHVHEGLSPEREKNKIMNDNLNYSDLLPHFDAHRTISAISAGSGYVLKWRRENTI